MYKKEDIIKYSKKLNLLYIEDNFDEKESPLTIFSEFFKNIIIPKDEKDILEELESSLLDLVIINIDMLKLNSLEIIKQIRKIDEKIAILALFTNDSKYFIECFTLDLDGYILNPIKMNQLLTTFNKITEKIKMQEELTNQILLSKQYQDAIDFSSIVSKSDAKGIITYVNDNFCRVSGYLEDELIGKPHNIVRHPDSKKETFKEMWRTIKDEKKEWNGIIKNRKKNGESYYVNSTIKPILDKNGEVIEYLSLRHNISSIMSDKQHFKDRIEQNTLSFLVLIQIDEFDMLEKFYNPSLLDKIEKKFSYKLLSFLPASHKFENVYNLDSGRYALISDFYKFQEKNIVIEEYLNEFILNIKNSIIEVDSIDYDLNITLSYAMGKHMLYEDAKAGLEEAINKDVMIFHSNDTSIEHQKEAKNNINTIKMLKVALDNYKVVSFFQPIINNQTKKIEKYESLVRVIDENDNVITPYYFLTISKKGTYYNKVTLRVLENSFSMLNKLTTSISINLSTLDIEKDETRNRIFELLEDYKEERHRLVFELLEDEEAKDFKTIKKFIKDVKALGISIAIDDFGAGYSNFERLLEFEPDILKIDGSLVKNIDENEYSLSVVKTIVAFAKEQKISTIAEFVENEKIFNILKDLGVDYSQGYYFGKPEPLNKNFLIK